MIWHTARIAVAGPYDWGIEDEIFSQGQSIELALEFVNTTATEKTVESVGVSASQSQLTTSGLLAEDEVIDAVMRGVLSRAPSVHPQVSLFSYT
jgi:hypothetical protein